LTVNVQTLTIISWTIVNLKPPVPPHHRTLRCCTSSYYITIIRPHCSIRSVDVACCYRPSNMVCRWSVCHTSEPAKTAEPIEMPFRLWARMCPRNHGLHGVQIPMGRGNFGEKGCPSAMSCAKQENQSICHLGCGLGWAEGSTCSIIFPRWR